MKTRKITVLFVILSILISVFGSVNTYAANKTDYMTKLGVTKGIKVGKAYKFNAVADVIGKVSCKWTLNKIKVSNASKKGYKELTFTATCKRKLSPTQSQIDQLCEYHKKYGSYSIGDVMYAVVDKYTGIDLEKAEAGKKHDVTVTTNEDKFSGYKKHYNSSGNYYIYYPTKWKVTVTVTFPEKYDGLCIGFGTSNEKNSTKADTKFFKGKKKFEKTSFWKAGKKYTRWLDISSIM